MSKIRIGERIKEKAREAGIGPTKLARMIGMTRTGIYPIFKKEFIDTELLRKFSKALNHDFFRYFSEDLSVADPEESIKFATKSELKNVEHKLDVLAKKLDKLMEQLLLETKSSYESKSAKGLGRSKKR